MIVEELKLKWTHEGAVRDPHASFLTFVGSRVNNSILSCVYE